MPSDRIEHGGGRDKAYHDAHSIQSIAVAEDAPTDGQVLAYAATNDRYVPAESGAGFFNGTFLESFDALVTSDGATVTMSIEQAGGGDLTMRFSDGRTTLDCTPSPATIPLDAGADDSPTKNFIYILQSTKVLTKSTSNWPADPIEHIKIGMFLVPSAGYVQAKGVYINHNTNDHAQGTGGQGHLVHITERLRASQAIYRSGSVLTISIGGGGTTVDVAITAGVVRQMHSHATPALNTATGDAVLVINQNGAAYDSVTDLETLTNDANGVAVKKYFNWVFWAVANKAGEHSPLMVSLSAGSYNQQQSAETDVSRYNVLTMPGEFVIDSATGFLVALVTMSLTGGTWAHVKTVDLRGGAQFVGGGVGGVTTVFADNAFKLFDETDVTKELVFQLSAITTGNTRAITAPDADLDLGEAVTAAAASGAANTVQVSGGADRTIQDAAGVSIFGHAALAAPVGLQFKNADGGLGLLTWWNSATVARFIFSNPVQLAAHIVDSNANEIIKVAEVASAVNEVTITNAVATEFPSVEASGDDTHIDLWMKAKGTAAIRTNAPLKILERAAAIGDTTAYGQLWVKNDAPCTLWFTDDTGVDVQLGTPGGAHDMLSATHTDSVADAVTRGSLIYGNATPKWDELVLGAAATYLRSDGADAAWTGLAIVDDPAPQLATDLDTQSFAINATGGTPVIPFELAGTEKCRVDENGNWCINATVSLGTTNRNLYIYNTGSAVLYLTTESDTAAQGPAHSYRRAKAGPANVASGNRLWGISSYGYIGGAYTLVGQMRSVMASTTASKMQIYTGTNDLALTVESTGDLTLEVAGSQINFGGTTTDYIKHDGGLKYNVVNATTHVFYINETASFLVGSTFCFFGPVAERARFEYATVGIFNIQDASGNELIRVEDGAKLFLFGGGTAITRPDIAGARDEPEGALKAVIDQGVLLGLWTDSTTAS